jgi:hypothetical protein
VRDACDAAAAQRSARAWRLCLLGALSARAAQPRFNLKAAQRMSAADAHSWDTQRQRAQRLGTARSRVDAESAAAQPLRFRLIS